MIGIGSDHWPVVEASVRGESQAVSDDKLRFAKLKLIERIVVFAEVIEPLTRVLHNICVLLYAVVRTVRSWKLEPSSFIQANHMTH